jgi:tetratricopeptide (TPR) repeat protein
VEALRGDLAAAGDVLSASVDDIDAIDAFARETAAEGIRALAGSNAVAGTLWAERLRTSGPADTQAVRERSLDAYRAAAALGGRRAAEWVAELEPDPVVQRALLTELLEQDPTGWAHFKLATLRVSDGDGSGAVTLMRQAAEHGWRTAMTDSTLLDACEDAERERWLRLADQRESGWGADLLGDLLAQRLGADHADVEAAYSRSDLRGDANGACDLGLVMYATQGSTAVVARSWERASRRGSATGAFNAGTMYGRRKEYERAVAAYERAIGLGDTDSYAALAALECERGDLRRALELAEEADARFSSGRTASTLADIRLANGNRFGAIEAYERADALGDAEAALELAELWDDEGDVEAALRRAEQRYADSTGRMWVCFTPYERAHALARIRQIRERRLRR